MTEAELAAIWLTLFVAMFASEGRSASELATAGAFALVLFPVLVVANLVVNTRYLVRSDRLLAEAEAALGRDPDRAMLAAREAIAIGTSASDKRLRSWMVLAQIAEARGEFADADEALNRGLVRRGRGVRWDRGLVVHALLRRAFACAAHGAVDEAERCLRDCYADELANPLYAAEEARARIVVAYRRGHFREVAERVTDAFGRGAVADERHRGLLEALRQSSMLRLDAEAGVHPMRVAADVHEADDWVDALVDPRRARAR